MIEFIHTAKSFGRHIVHRDINLKIPKGKVTFIIGPSGTGKSIFIKQIIGLVKPDKGKILIDGRDITTMGEHDLLDLRKNFGYLFQDAALFDSMNVFENVAFPLREHTNKTDAEIKKTVRDKLAKVGLKGIENKFPSELSGGMRKRVGLARATIMEPHFMLYDEPTTGLDPIMTDVVDQLILDTQQSTPGMTSIVISHDVESTLSSADEIAMIYDGVIVAQGTPEFFTNSADPVVVQFFSGSREGPIRV